MKSWEPPKKKDDDKTPADERYNDYRIPGATFRTTMNDRSYLTFGVARPPFVLIEGAREEALYQRIMNAVRESDEAQTSPVVVPAATHDFAPPDPAPFCATDEPPSRPA